MERLYFPKGASCEKYLEENYVLVRRLGAVDETGKSFEGTYGVVLQLVSLKHGGDTKAVKIINDTQEARKEINIMNTLRTLRSTTPIFIHTFGYVECSNIPKGWLDYIGELPDNFSLRSDLLYIFMDYANFRLTDNTIRLTLMDFKQIFFILLHGLESAFNKLGFTHGDIHDEQILLVPRNHDNPIFVGNRQLHVRFLPKLLDYGFSDTEADIKQHNQDVHDLTYILRKKLYVLKDMDIVSSADVNEYKRFEKGITTTSAYFNDLFQMEDTDENQTNVQKCIQCAANANHLIDNNYYYYYPICGKICARAWLKKDFTS